MTDLLEVGARFKIEGKPYSCEDHGSGHIHRTHLLISGEPGEQSRYILQSLNTYVFNKPEAVQDNIRRVLDYLKNKSPADPKNPDLEIIETLDGEILHVDRNGNFWRCYRYIENSIIYETVTDPGQAYEGALTFGRFAARLMGYSPRRLHVTIPHFMDAEWRDKQLIYAEFTNPGERLSRVQPELKRVRDLAEIPMQFTRIRTALPDRVVHNDTKISNVLFDEKSGKGKSIIDLDTVMTGTLLTDFGDMVRSFTPPGKEDKTGPDSFECREDVFGALSDGFSEAASHFLSDIERSNLLLGAKTVIYMQAVRFLTDYLKGDVYYRTEHPEQNLYRTRNQLGLLESLLAKEDLLQGILDRAF